MDVELRFFDLGFHVIRLPAMHGKRPSVSQGKMFEFVDGAFGACRRAHALNSLQ